MSADLAKVTLALPFNIPPYFALIIRAISVLEGIALVGDDKFAVIDEAYPYIAKRLLTDNDPRVKKSLEDLIYDNKGELKVDKFIELLESFEVYAKINNAATDMSLMDLSRNDLKRSNSGDGSVENTREALLFFFSDDGAYLRSLLEDTLTDGIESLSKGAVLEVLKNVTNLDQELNLPNGGKKKLSDFKSVNLSASDELRIEQIVKIWNFFGPTSKNLGMKQKDLPFPFSNSFLNPFGADPDYLLTLGTGVGPYIPVVAP